MKPRRISRTVVVGCCAALLLRGILPAMADDQTERIDLREIAKGAFSGFQEPARLVITNQTQWAEAWQKHSSRRTPAPSVPDIDFKKETALFVAMGRKNSGGYAIEIEEVRRGPKGLVATVKTREPAAGAITLQALSAPFHIVAVKVKDEPVRFQPAGKTGQAEKGERLAPEPRPESKAGVD